jgi:hypothetical protein
MAEYTGKLIAIDEQNGKIVVGRHVFTVLPGLMKTIIEKRGQWETVKVEYGDGGRAKAVILASEKAENG